ncbi:MAG: hypothetical protein ACTSPB_02060 [Candidatus Thorarchaeota archaeon]
MGINLDIDSDVKTILEEIGQTIVKRRFTEEEDPNNMGRVGSVTHEDSNITYGYISPTTLTTQQLSNEGWKLSGDRTAIFADEEDVQILDRIATPDFTSEGSRIYEVVETMAEPRFGGLAKTYTYCLLKFVEEIE